MDPKGDRLRKIQSGQLKLPESVLKSNNIVLTPDKPVTGGGGCLEGGPRPRPVTQEETTTTTIGRTPIIIPLKGDKMTLSPAEIPLPSLKLPQAGDIPLPATDMESIPLPKIKHDEIPLPSNDSIPLPADKPVVQHTERKKIRVVLEPKGDELLCRSCVMKFTEQIEYDTHLQSDAHQQAIKSTDIHSHGASLLMTKRHDKSPSHDSKTGHVSFRFKNTIGSKITNSQPFIPVRREERRGSPVEVKVLKPEGENGVPQKDVTTSKTDVTFGRSEKTTDGPKVSETSAEEKSESGSERNGEKDGEKVQEPKLLLCDFVKVQSKDDSGRVLDWPKEMIQYTKTEPKLMYSCNPLSFDFSMLFANKKKSQDKEGQGLSEVNSGTEVKEVKGEETEEKIDDDKNEDGEKKKSHKKKKKKHKHKKSKEKTEIKSEEQGEQDENAKPEEEGTSSSKKKKKKHKKKQEDKELDTSKDTCENSEAAEDKDKKKHKKSKKKSKQSADEGEAAGDEEKKHKKKKKRKSKKRKKKHQDESELEKSDVDKEKQKEKEKSGESEKESDTDKKDKDGKSKKKKRKKHRRSHAEGSDSEVEKGEKSEPAKVESVESTEIPAVGKRKFPEGDSDGESEKIVAKLQALNRTKTAQKQTNVVLPVLQKKIKKEPVENNEKKRTPSDRKRMNSESSVTESTPVKKVKVTPKSNTLKENIPVQVSTQVPNVKVEKELSESWSKIETQTNDNVKSKWDTSDSDMDNALDNTLKKDKVLKKRAPAKNNSNIANIMKDLKSPPGKACAKTVQEQKKTVNQSSSQRSNKSNISAGSSKIINSINDRIVRKSRKVSKSPASSHSRSRSRSHNRHRSYSHSRSSSRSRSRSYSTSSYYSDDSRHSRHRRSRRSSSRSYSRSSSRSRSGSYERDRSSSYSDYSRSRSYTTSRSRSRSHRRRKRSYSRSRSRSYTSSSYSSRSRSRTRSYRKGRKKSRRKKMVMKDLPLSLSPAVKDLAAKKKDKIEKEKIKEEKDKVNPADIPLPDLSGKKDDERTEEKLQKLKEKKRRTDVGETVAKLVESLPENIPLPFSEGVTKTVSSDSLPSGPPGEPPKENDSGFIGPKMPGPPPPPPNMGQRFPPNHGPPGPPRPGYTYGQWDHWDGPGHWEGHGPWDGPRPPYRGMRPPYDPRMYGPFDPRRRGPPPHFMRPRGPNPYMGPRYPGPHGPPPEYDHEYMEYDYANDYAKDEPPKSNTPPPLPKDPPKESEPNPPLPKKKGKDQQEPEQNPDIVIPPEQAEQYKHLQKQAQKHARRQLRRQAKKELGEPDEDSTSSESEPEEQPVEEVTEELAVLDETQVPQLVAIPQQVLLQPQPAGSPSGAYIIVSGGQQYLVQKPHYVQAGIPIQAGQPMVAAVSQGAIMASAAAAAAGAHPAHLLHQVPYSGHHVIATPAHLGGGMVMTSASLQQLQQIQQIQQLQQLQQIQQFQQAQAIQAHNQAVAAAASHGPIVVGNRILVPTLGVRPAI